MDVWEIIWGGLLATVLLVYAILAITIAIGGFFDVKEMLSTMEDQHEELTNDE